jgi:hypothetical protein
VAAPPASPAVSVLLPFHQLGQRAPMHLQVLDGGQVLPFSVRADEVVTDLRLRLQITLAPELPRGAQLKVLLNDESIALLPIEREAGAAPLVRELALDARLLTDYNRLLLQLVAPRERVCERLDRAQLWAEIGTASTLAMTVERLPIANDLALLPAPFFDPRDNRRLALAVQLPPQRSPAVLQAAGVLASWFGALAAYRGAELRSVLDTDALPPLNTLVLATPGNAPAGITLPALTGPTIRLIDHPGQPHAKLLLVLGRDDDELQWAAQALSLGQLDRQGDSATPSGPRHPPARRPYDAPTWLPTHRPVRLDAIAGTSPGNLRAQGAHPAPLQVDFRLPPDLHFSRQDSVPLDLRWSHTSVPSSDRSALRLSVNGTQLRQFNFSSTGLLGSWFSTPVAGQIRREHHGVDVPGGLFAHQPANQLGLRFDYDVPVDDACAPRQAGQQLSEIDPGSTLDFSDLPHFIGLPDLTAFANGGFPYSRLADLSGSAVLLPEQASRSEIDFYLGLLSHLGRSTGVPATGLVVGTSVDATRLAERDLLLIGTPARLPLLRQWAADLPLRLSDGRDGGGEGNDDPGAQTPWWRDVWRSLRAGLGWPDRHSQPALNQLDAAALVGFESPLRAGRSVIAFTAQQSGPLASLGDALLTPALLGSIHGQITLVEQGKVRSVDDGPSYYVGDVGLFARLRLVFARHPLGLALLLSGIAIVLALVCAGLLRRLAQRRLANGDERPDTRHLSATPASAALPARPAHDRAAPAPHTAAEPSIRPSQT